DNSLWDSMYECFAEDSMINISWFKGSGKAFVDASREMNRYAPHQIYNSQIWINQDRAVAIMQATIQTRLPINEVQMQLNSDAKIVYGLVK
ncbi:bile acid 7-alpha dehydratase, partial [Staphylococcus epidermidis]